MSVIRLGDARLLDGAVGAQAAAASVRRARNRLASAKSENTRSARGRPLLKAIRHEGAGGALRSAARRKRQLALHAMAEADIPRLTQPDFTASLRQGAPALEVVAEDEIPAVYWKPQAPKLDRQGILAALKAGSAIDGVALAMPQVQLSVRTK